MKCLKRFIASALISLISHSSIADSLTPQIGGGISFGFDGGISGVGTIVVAPTFFVSNDGSDAANGLTPATAWLTIAHVNAQVFPFGSTISFNGGQTFTGGIVLTSSNAFAPTITSYGTGKAIISSGNSAECAAVTNVPGFRANNIVCTGGGNLTSNTNGFTIVNSQAGNTKLAGPTISTVAISGYGVDGISVRGTAGTSGFNGITITDSTIQDVTGNSTDPFGTAAILIGSLPGYGLGATSPSHLNVTIKRNTILRAPGNSGATLNWTGGGIFIAQTGGSIIVGGASTDGNTINTFGGSNGSTFEPGGILLGDGAPSSCFVSYNELSNGGTGPSGTFADGGGFDGGLTGCIGEHNKIHDNAGISWLYENYFDGTCCVVWGNNTFRYNLVQNNNPPGTNNKAEILFHFPLSATGPGFVYGNTIVSQTGGNAFGDSSDSTGTYTITIANNLILVNNASKITQFQHAPAGLLFAGNDYFTYGAATTYTWNGTTYSSFSAWQTATGQEKIAGSNVGLTSNPQIYVPGGLFATNGYNPAQDMANNLQAGSPMIGTGLNLTSLFGINPGTTDYYGAAITATSLPIGAAAGDFATFAASSTAATNFLARTTGFSKLDNVNYNSLLSSGYFANCDLLYVPAAPNQAAANLNLLAATFPLTNNGATWLIRHGYTGNGTTAFLDTGWKASTNAVNYTLASVTHFGYALTNGAADSKALYGAQNVAGTSETTSYAGTGGWYADANDFTGTSKAAITSSNGMFLLNRTSGVLTASFNGAVVPSPVSVATVAMPDQNMRILQANGDAGSFSANTVTAVGFGAGGQNDVAIAQQINSFMMAYGINVY